VNKYAEIADFADFSKYTTCGDDADLVQYRNVGCVKFT
jgi:hypothetical protein